MDSSVNLSHAYVYVGGNISNLSQNEIEYGVDRYSSSSWVQYLTNKTNLIVLRVFSDAFIYSSQQAIDNFARFQPSSWKANSVLVLPGGIGNIWKSQIGNEYPNMRLKNEEGLLQLILVCCGFYTQIGRLEYHTTTHVRIDSLRPHTGTGQCVLNGPPKGGDSQENHRLLNYAKVEGPILNQHVGDSKEGFLSYVTKVKITIPFVNEEPFETQFLCYHGHGGYLSCLPHQDALETFIVIGHSEYLSDLHEKDSTFYLPTAVLVKRKKGLAFGLAWHPMYREEEHFMRYFSFNDKNPPNPYVEDPRKMIEKVTSTLEENEAFVKVMFEILRGEREVDFSKQADYDNPYVKFHRPFPE